MPDANIPIPRTIRWNVFWLIVSNVIVFLVTAAWIGRGIYNELQSAREATDAAREATNVLAAEQRITNERIDARVTTIERSISRSDVQMEWVIKALERQERRSGYTPPPLPQP